MSFASVPFFILVTITFILYAVCKNIRVRHVILLIASYAFYAYWDARFLALMIFQTFVSYIIAWKIDQGPENREKWQKSYLVLGIIILLSLLGFFKYFNFFVSSFYQAFGIGEGKLLNIILPIGISFYTFQAISYLMDVYGGETSARKSFLQISLYISFFPQLVAGPIVRSTDFLYQLDEEQEVSVSQTLEGIQIFMFGLFKKVVIADRLAVAVDTVFAAPAAYNAPSLIMAVLAYTIQIYCDFSGYSDMAIGTAKVFGFDLCQNFNLPYLSKGIPEFWRRWHISCGSWFRDYLMYPLQKSEWCQALSDKLKASGHKKTSKFVPSMIGALVVWFATGLWHGAAWTYVAWGMYYGILLILSMIFDKLIRKISKKIHFGNGGIFDIFRIIRTDILIVIGYVFFRSDSFSTAFLILKRIFTWAGGMNYIFIYSVIFIILVFAAQIYAYVKNNGNGFYISMDMSKFSSKLIFNIVLLVLFSFAYFGDTAFIYFQF